MTSDYKRNGTTDLFAALNVGTGEVLHQTRKTHKGTDVLAFFKWIDLHTPRDLEVHVVLDNLSAHTAPEVRAWLAKPAQARWHLHFTPTSSSWLNLVEGWFAQLTNKRLRTGSFNSLDALTEAIDIWVSHWNDDPRPFVWTKTAKQIITKVKRGRAALTHQTKSATDHPRDLVHVHRSAGPPVLRRVVEPTRSQRRRRHPRRGSHVSRLARQHPHRSNRRLRVRHDRHHRPARLPLRARDAGGRRQHGGARLTFAGTHVGDFLGRPPTGRPVRWAGAAFFHSNGAAIVDIWLVGDLANLTTQLQT